MTPYTPPDFNMGKLEYALFLKTLPIKVGDLVTTQYQKAPFYPGTVYKVHSIDEIHKFVEFCHPTIGPKCLNLQRVDGTVVPWKGGARLYHKIEDADIPQEWIGVA